MPAVGAGGQEIPLPPALGEGTAVVERLAQSSSTTIVPEVVKEEVEEDEDVEEVKVVREQEP